MPRHASAAPKQRQPIPHQHHTNIASVSEIDANVRPYTTGKNASDITLIIDAMDLLHSSRLDLSGVIRQ